MKNLSKIALTALIMVASIQPTTTKCDCETADIVTSASSVAFSIGVVLGGVLVKSPDIVSKITGTSYRRSLSYIIATFSTIALFNSYLRSK